MQSFKKVKPIRWFVFLLITFVKLTSFCVHYIVENQEDLKLPTRVLVELKPKDMNSWMKVQSLAQNPLLRTAAPLQKRLSSLMSSLKEKWKSPYLTAVSFSIIWKLFQLLNHKFIY